MGFELQGEFSYAVIVVHHSKARNLSFYKTSALRTKKGPPNCDCTAFSTVHARNECHWSERRLQSAQVLYRVSAKKRGKILFERYQCMQRHVRALEFSTVAILSIGAVDT